MPAHITAKMVIASAKRLMLVRQFCLNKNRMAEISVPAWPMPTQKTKLTIGKPQKTALLLPHTPVPVRISNMMVILSTPSRPSAIRKPTIQPMGVCLSG